MIVSIISLSFNILLFSIIGYECLRFNTLIDEGEKFSLNQEYDRADSFFKQALHYGKKNSIIINYDIILVNLSEIQYKQGKYMEAINYEKEVLQKYQRQNNFINAYHAYNIIGFNYLKLSNYDQSIFYYMKAIELSKEIKFMPDSGTFFNLSMAYYHTENYVESIKYAEFTYHTGKDNNDPTFQLMGLSQLAQCYDQMGDNEKAKEYYDECLNFIPGLENLEFKKLLKDRINRFYIKINQKSPT
jgi:tetratricopeptide (TPR) repeat protein